MHAVGSSTRRIGTLLGVTTTKLRVYDVCLKALKGNFALNTRVTRINRKELLMLDNPHNEERIANYLHLRGANWRIVQQKIACQCTSWERPNLHKFALMRNHVSGGTGSR